MRGIFPDGLVVAVIIGTCAALCGGLEGQGEVPVRYDGYQLWRVTPQSDVELEMLRFLSDKLNVSFWIGPSTVGRPVDVMVAPSSLSELTPFFQRSFTSFKVLQTDIQNVITEQYRDRAKPGAAAFHYGQYHTLADINDWMDSMVRHHSNLVTKIDIGQSYERRTIHGLKISVTATASRNHSNHARAGKPSIFIQGGIHAREWISPATVIFMTNQLLKGYKEGLDDIRKILDEFDWYILPVFNVDGYVYTWTNNRLWRKTRSPTINPLCTGTDPNRNWDNHWGDPGCNKNPCSETYCGSRAFSEIEVQTVASFLNSSDINFVGFIDFHSYSQLWMTPYGWTSDTPADFFTQNKQSAHSVRALTAVHGTIYDYGTIANTIYAASGNSVDWAYENQGILYSATVELRDMGQYGFLLPANQIIPTGEETLAGLIAYALFILTD